MTIRGLRRRVTWIALLAASALALAACGGAETPAVESATITGGGEREVSAEVMAAAIRQLITKDHTFGQGAHPFTEYLIQDHVDPSAGAPADPDAQAPRVLTDTELAAIEAVVAPFGPHRVVGDADEWRTEDLQPAIEGSAILGVGEPAIDGDTALVPVSLWCGNVCGTWLSYRLDRVDGVWTVTGTEGLVAVS